jgi:hypothetical protein
MVEVIVDLTFNHPNWTVCLLENQQEGQLRIDL